MESGLSDLNIRTHLRILKKKYVIPEVDYDRFVSCTGGDVEKLVDILVYMIKNISASNGTFIEDYEARERVKLLEKEVRELKEKIASLEKAESYASRQHRIQKGEKKIAEKEVDLKKVLKLWKEKKSVTYISDMMKISRPTVYDRLDELVEMGLVPPDYKKKRK